MTEDHPRPPVGSRWTHADGGRYRVTGYRNHKCRVTGEWYLSVEYDHDDGTRNPNGLGYGTDLGRRYTRFTPYEDPLHG